MTEAAPRIVIKRPVIAGGHHGGAWKIAYADFMTAMFAFFLVMWLLASASPQQLAGIADHFKMPLKEALTGNQKSSVGSGVIPGGADPTQQQGAPKEIADPNENKSDGASDAEDGKRLEDLKKRLDEMIEASPVLKQFRPQLLIDITPEGLRIQIVDSSNRPMFSRSSAVVAPYMRTILRELGTVLNDQPTKLTLSGHTDETQYAQGDKSYSNWELSADRANASRRELVGGGMEDKKVLRIMGVASSMHLNKDDPHAAVNRRISIVVLNRRTQQDIENANSAIANSKAGAAQQGEVKVPVVSPPLPPPKRQVS